MDIAVKRVSYINKFKIKEENVISKNFKFILILCQCFGLLPVCGITSPQPKFIWKAKRVVYSISLLCMMFFALFMSFFRICRRGIILHTSASFAFYLHGFLANVLLLKLARNWPKFMREWRFIESSMGSYGGPKNMQRPFTIVTLVVLGGCFAEHVLSIASRYTIAKLTSESEDDYSEIEIRFFYIEYPFIFDYVTYSLSMGIFIQVINMFTLFAWNITDLFIIIMSTALSVKFEQVNFRIRSACSMRMDTEHFWRKIRADYNSLCILCRKLDSKISYLTLISFGNNLYFILIQLYRSLKRRNTVIESIFFFYSFCFLLLRTIAVCLFAARINDESKEPLAFLNSLPTRVYGLEVQRLIHQISTQTVALTGMKLFNITRGLIFSIAGTIVTYELFLLQFNVNINY